MTSHHCDQCLVGNFWFSSCCPCACNEFTALCDPDTGSCFNCGGFTTGINCKRYEILKYFHFKVFNSWAFPRSISVKRKLPWQQHQWLLWKFFFRTILLFLSVSSCSLKQWLFCSFLLPEFLELSITYCIQCYIGVKPCFISYHNLEMIFCSFVCLGQMLLVRRLSYVACCPLKKSFESLKN